jgi:hypothetical protein
MLPKFMINRIPIELGELDRTLTTGEKISRPDLPDFIREVRNKDFLVL